MTILDRPLLCMPSQRNRKNIVFSTILVLISLSSGSAWASGISAPSVGTNRSNATSEDASALYWNPGMLGFQQEHPTLMLGANLIIGSIRYQRNYRGVYQRPDSFDFDLPIDPENIDPTKSGYQDDGNHLVFGPQPHLFLNVPIKDTGLTAGFGLYAPFTAIVNFPDDGAQRFTIQDALIATVYMTPSLSYMINEHVSIGAGVSFVLGYAELTRTQDFAEVEIFGEALSGPPVNQDNDFGANAPIGVRELNVLARETEFKHMIATGVTFNVGSAFKFDPVTIGLAYQHSTELNFRGKFALDMDDDFFTQDLESQGLDFPPLVEGDASLSFTLPNMIHTSLGVDVSDRVRLTGNFSYYFWSTVEAFNVVLQSPDLAQPDLGIGSTTKIALARDWKNSVSLEGVLAYDVKEDWELWGLLGYQSNAVPDRTLDASSPDGQRLEVGAGLVHRFSDRLDLLADLKVQHVLTRENKASAYDKGNGKYGLTLLSLGLHLNIRLGRLGDKSEGAKEAESSGAHGEPIETREIPATDATHTDATPSSHKEGDGTEGGSTTDIPQP